ncbi:hypothetical protein HN652_01115 [archaeon]|jgi:hypothetical protein|nr:hypothetical protein [archaeon]MBT6868908.1 hypothetical protein [archaeon]MBT7192871.1 hypothetical protein [archaeon]MBT7380837.1 hypothetical protein [archaeon]MBT7507592.1 hypothetical protein [archaeon]
MYLGKRGDFVVLTVIVLLILFASVLVVKEGFTGAAIIDTNQSFSFGIMPSEESANSTIGEVAIPDQIDVTIPDSNSEIISDEQTEIEDVSNENNYDVLIDDEPVLSQQSEYSLETNSLTTNMNYSDANWSLIAETNSGLYLGYGISNAGDINGDNFDELLFINDDTGEVHLIYGSENLTGDFSISDVNTNFSGTYSVYATNGLGDINNDSYDDFGIIEYTSYDMYIFYGGFGNPWLGDVLLNESNITIQGSSGFGYSIVGNCDINNDGFGDFMVSNTLRTGYKYGVGNVIGAGVTKVYLGGNAIDEPILQFSGQSINENSGRELACADINNDDYDDMFITSNEALLDGYSSGAVFVFYGGSTSDLQSLNSSCFNMCPLNTTKSNFTIYENENNNANFGTNLEIIDLNNDSNKDILISEYSAKRIFIINFNTSMLPMYDASQSYTLGSGGTTITSLPYDLKAGNINGDDYDDFVFSAGNSTHDMLLVFYGRDVYDWENGSISANSTIFIENNDGFGSEIILGNYSLDSSLDLFVGSPDWEGGNSDGRLDLFFGIGGVNITSPENGPSNSASLVTNLSLQTITGYNRTNENLLVTYNYTDAENDTVKQIINWYKNNVSFNVLNLQFEDSFNSAKTVDFSIYSNNGTINGATYNNGSGYDDFGSYTFDGDNDYIMFPNSSVYSTGLVDEFAVTARINLNNSKLHTIISYPGLTDNKTFHFGVNSLDQLFIELSNGTNFTNIPSSSCPVPLNQWVFVAIRYEPGGSIPLALHVDNCVETFNPIVLMDSLLKGPVIGGKLSHNSWYLNGTVDEVKIFDKVLSSTQINKIRIGQENVMSYQDTLFNDTWSVDLKLYDKTDFSTVYYTNNLTITNYNTVSTVENVTLSTLTGYNQTTENITLTYDPVTDDENDTIKNIINWYKDNVSLSMLNLPFEGGSNTTWTRDFSGYNYNGAVEGATWNLSGGYDGFGAYELDGVDDYINLSEVGEFNFTNQITVAAWVKPTSFPTNWVKYIVRGRDSCGPPYVNIYFGTWDSPSENKPRWALGLDSTSVETNESISFEMNASEWYYLVGTYNGSNLILYANGQIIDDRPFSGIIDDVNNPFGIGQELSGCTGDYFNGSIDDVMILNYSLTAEQIYALYQNQTDLIVSQETSLNDVWSATVTGTDRWGYGDYVLSNELNVTNYNTAPSLVNPTLLPNIVDTTTDIIGRVTYLDDDDDDGTVYFQWYVNGINVYNDTINYANNTDLIYSTLGSENYSRDDSINFTAYTFDGFDNSSVISSSTKTVVNYIPTHMVPILNSSRPLINNTLHDLFAYNQTTYDPDADSIKNEYIWKKDGSPITLVNTPFDGESIVSYAIDLSGNSHHLTICGYNESQDCDPNTGPTWNQTGGYDSFGAYELDGINDYLDLNNATNQSEIFDSVVIEQSYEFWYNANDISNEQMLLDRGNQFVGLNIYINDSQLWAGAWSAEYSWTDGWINTSTTVNEWHHVVLTFDSVNFNLLKLYHDGTLIDQKVIPGSLAVTTGDDALGAISDKTRFPNGTYTSQFGMFYNGSIDEFRVYNSSLSAAQINLLYNNLTNQIDSAETNANDVWSVEIYPSDGYRYGTINESNNVTISDLTCGDIDYNVTLSEYIAYSGNDTCFTITGDDILFDLGGYTLNSTSSYGVAINVSNHANVNITNGYLRGFDEGIYAQNSTNLILSNLDIRYNDIGINLINVNDSSIYTNQIRTNGEGINLTSCYDNNISNNFFYNSGGNNDDVAVGGNNNWNLTYNCSITNWTNIAGGNCQGGNSWHGYSGSDDGSGVYPNNVSRDWVGDTLIPYNSSSQILVGGDYLPLICYESWTCSSWSSCISGTQYRTCTDANECATTITKPIIARSCSGGGGGSSSSSSSSGGGPTANTNPANQLQRPPLQQGPVIPIPLKKLTPDEVKSLIEKGELKIIFKQNTKQIYANSPGPNNPNGGTSTTTTTSSSGSSSSSGGGSGSSGYNRVEISISNINLNGTILVNPAVVREQEASSDNLLENQIREKLFSTFASNFNLDYSDEELEKLVTEKSEIIKRMEAENVKPIIPYKTSNFGFLNLDSYTTTIFNSPQQVTGRMLIPSIDGLDDIEIESNNTVNLNFSVSDYISLNSNDNYEIQLQVEDEVIYSETLSYDNQISSSGIVFDSLSDGTLDIYILLPANDIVIDGKYYLEYNLVGSEINLDDDESLSNFALVNLIFNRKKTFGTELHGPYHLNSTEDYILAQNFQLPDACSSSYCELNIKLVDAFGGTYIDGSYYFDSPSQTDITKIGNENNDLLTGMVINEFDNVEVNKNLSDYLIGLFVLIFIGLVIYFYSDIKKFTAKSIIKINRLIRKFDNNTYHTKKIDHEQKNMDQYLQKIRKIYNPKKKHK